MAKKHDELGKSPFTYSLSIPSMWVLSRPQGFNTTLIDSESYVKVYTDLTYMLTEMTQAELQLLGYIMRAYPGRSTEDGVQQDYMELTYSKVNMPESSFHRAKAELMIKNVIAKRPQRQGTYWINPALIFRGNRIKSYPECASPRNKDVLAQFKLGQGDIDEVTEAKADALFGD